jgi:hypothetical protein
LRKTDGAAAAGRCTKPIENETGFLNNNRKILNEKHNTAQNTA